MKQIQLTRGQMALVDDDDFERVNQYKWRVYRNKYGDYYAQNDGRGGERVLARFIMNAPKGMVVDHINHNTLDNQKSNLRICTQSENMANSTYRQKRKTSKYKGVSWDKDLNKWRATIHKNYKKTHIGVFTNEREAALAYNRMAKKHFGEFACLNIITDKEPT